MNMGVADAFDLGWKLASVIHGFGGEGLLQSYELERKPVAVANVERSGVHFGVHQQLKTYLDEGDSTQIDKDTEEGLRMREKIHEHYQTHDGENKDFGVEMGYRYRSPIIIQDESGAEPERTPSRYTPTSWPGGRPPHTLLSNGTPIFDRFGKYWTLLVFTDHECGRELLVEAAKTLGIPLELVDLSEEQSAKKLYEKPLVLIRPDQHVAWRADSIAGAEEGRNILRTVTGSLERNL